MPEWIPHIVSLLCIRQQFLCPIWREYTSFLSAVKFLSRWFNVSTSVVIQHIISMGLKFIIITNHTSVKQQECLKDSNFDQVHEIFVEREIPRCQRVLSLQ